MESTEWRDHSDHFDVSSRIRMVFSLASLLHRRRGTPFFPAHPQRAARHPPLRGRSDLCGRRCR
jgi:hypothetical protein